MSDLTAHYTEELIVTLQGLYNRPNNFTWMEARPVLAELLCKFRAECQQSAAPDLAAEVKRLQNALARWEYRSAVDGQNGAMLRWADGAAN